MRTDVTIADVVELASRVSAAYTKLELAYMLASIWTTGEIPGLPNFGLTPVPPGARGRPTRVLSAQRQELLRDTLRNSYPRPTDVATLSRHSGMSRAGVTALQSDAAFLSTLPNNLQSYFQQVKPEPLRSRLGPVWRALLDLHNYLTTKELGKAQPLYELHSVFWGSNLARVSGRALSMYNAHERNRLEDTRFLAATGLDVLTTEGFAALDECPCSKGCELARAFVLDQGPTTVGEARKLLGLHARPDGEGTALAPLDYAEVLAAVV